MSTANRISESARSTLRVIAALRGHSITGLSNGELAKALAMTPATVNRCLNTLIAEGFAIKLDTGRFALSVALLQIAQSHANEMHNAQNRINELQQRVLAGSH